MENNIDNSLSLMYDTLAVIIQTRDGKVFQVALTDEMIECLYFDLKMYFNKGVINVLPDEIKDLHIEKTNTITKK